MDMLYPKALMQVLNQVNTKGVQSTGYGDTDAWVTEAIAITSELLTIGMDTKHLMKTIWSCSSYPGDQPSAMCVCQRDCRLWNVQAKAQALVQYLEDPLTQVAAS